jgi:alkylresorcinol/alkylpyrone synthase
VIQSSNNAVILSVGTALPPYQVQQNDVRQLCRSLFSDGFRDLERLINVFDNGQIKTRHLCTPLDWFGQDHSFAEKNALYVEHALNLGEAAARQALERANTSIDAIGTILFVSTTGLATPSLDSWLIKRLGASCHTRRLPLWGLGCAGGAVGLAQAGQIASASGQAVLLVAVELCSLTFQRHDYSKSNLIAASLFADGAAAVVVAPHSDHHQAGPSIYSSFSTLLDETEDIMGWDVVETGLKVRFSRDVPALVLGMMRENIGLAAAQAGLSLSDLKHFITHPGGLKVLAAYSQALDLAEHALDDSFAVLQQCGNMSSVSVLFVLERFLQRYPTLTKNQHAILSAMGPGFSAEHVILAL